MRMEDTKTEIRDGTRLSVGFMPRRRVKNLGGTSGKSSAGDTDAMP
jgi:hypothetical protein